jgi:hypothetical protein
MTTTCFVKAVEEVIAKQVPENDRPLFAQRQAWLATAVELERAKGIGH